MKIVQQEKEKHYEILGTLKPTDICWINSVLYMVISAPDEYDNVIAIKLGTGELCYLSDRTSVELADCFMVVNV